LYLLAAFLTNQAFTPHKNAFSHGNLLPVIMFELYKKHKALMRFVTPEPVNLTGSVILLR